ncbi:MAG: penicillin-binding protein 2 [Candidatus Paceibacterota bacterium]
MLKNLRINFILALIFFAGGIVLFRLFILQVQDGDHYKAIAQGRQISTENVQGERGAIYFINGEPLALTEKQPYVFISPKEMINENKEKIAEELEKIIDLKKQDILFRTENVNSQYEILKEKLTEQEAEAIKKSGLKGVYLDYWQARVYPNNKMAGQLSGYLNKDKKGQYGLEEYYDDILQEKDLIEKSQTNIWSFFTSQNNETSTNGESIKLTIDYNIQYMAEKILAENAKEFEYKSGQIIVMDPYTGAIIAMAQYPLFDPNNYQNEKNFNIFQNDSIQKIFEPGSIFKAITMAAAINEKAVTPETTYNDDKGYIMYGTYKVANYNEKIWGLITMTNALEHSVNTALMEAEKRLGHEKFFQYLENFGFFEKTGIDLSGEVASKNKELEKAIKQNIAVNLANVSFGQGIGITPLHITSAYCTIANGGNSVKPYLVKEKDNGIQKQEIEPTIIKRILSTETTNTMKKMLVSVIENGYGHQAKIPGYYIAGKTGTAQIPWTSLNENKTGYSPQTWQTFLGFAPAYDPKFVALVKLDNPEAIKTSEYSATPMFHDLAKYILDYWQIPPDYSTAEE